MTETSTEDFLDDVPYAAPTSADASPSRRRIPVAATTAGWLVGGIVIGAIAVGALHTSHGSTTAFNPAATANGTAGGPGSTGSGFVPGGGAFAPGPGGRDGEQHIVGTLTSVSGSSFTMTTPTGMSTYTIDASTLLVSHGQRVTSLSAFGIGDTVVAHVFPASGSTRVQTVLDGVPPGDDGAPGDDNNGATTTT